MYIKEYSVKKQGRNFKITPNIELWEIQCHDGTDYVRNDIVITSIVQYIRDYHNKPVNISGHSGYRTFDYNAKVPRKCFRFKTYKRLRDRF